MPETPDGGSTGFGSGLGGVLSIGPGLGGRRAPEAPRSDPSDVSTAGAGYGATGAQIVVDRTVAMPSVAQRTSGPDADGDDGTRGGNSRAGTDTEGARRARDQQHGG